MSDVQRRLTSQLLAGAPASSAGAVVRRLLAVQAQDGQGARLAIRARSKGLTASDVDRALGRGELVVSWLNRGTLHLVAAEDYWLLHPLTTPQLATGNVRRLHQEGVGPAEAERGIEVVASAVESGPLTRVQLRDRLAAAGVPAQGQALVHVLMAASLAGRVVRGPMIGNDHAFVSVERWLGPAPPPLPRDEALTILANRYLAGHAPASPQDLAKWAGITLADARRGFARAQEPSVRTRPLPRPKLLGAFDPLLHGWLSREPLLGGHHNVVTSNGIFRPVALVDGRIVAVWSLPRGVVTITPLEPIGRAARQTLAVDAADVLRYLQLPDRPAVIE